MILRYGARFARAVGCDHSPEMLQIARAKLVAWPPAKVRLVRENALRFLQFENARYDLITCVGCLHHLPPVALGELLSAMRSRLARRGMLLLAEPVRVPATSAPAAIERWNRASVMRERAALMPLEDSDEAPIEADWLLEAPARFGLCRQIVSRGWELFPRHLPARISDRLALHWLHWRHGSGGNIVAALWQAG